MKKFFLITLMLSLFTVSAFAQYIEVMEAYDDMINSLERGHRYEEASAIMQNSIDTLVLSPNYPLLKRQYPELAQSIMNMSICLENRNISGLSKWIRVYSSNILQIQNNVLFHTTILICGFSVFLIFIAIITVLFLTKNKHERESTKTITAIYREIDSERMRISRELHDTVAQELLGAALKVENIDGNNESEIDDLAHKLRESITEIRNVCYNLNPPAFLDDKDFEIALIEMCHNFEQKSGIKCTIYFDGENLFENTSENEKLNIYRIATEALENVHKHSLAENATVNFRRNKKKGLAFFISDDGIGFDAEKTLMQFSKLQSDRHFGLNGIIQRAKIIGGKAEIFAEPDDGCTIKVTC